MTKKLFAGFSIAVLAFAVAALPAAADIDNVEVKNNNDAYVKNDVDTTAKTGGNTANGGNGGSGGNGGDITNSGDDVELSDTGSGGNGGDGGWATVLTGDATAKSKVINKVNTNITELDLCDCADIDGDIKVKNHNHAKVKNYVDTTAKTGGNNANAGSGGSGGNAGDIDNLGGDDVENSTTGTGGTGGIGWDADVTTGTATAKTKVVNRVNKNVTRIPPTP